MNATPVFEPSLTRQTILAALPAEFSAQGQPPEPRHLYVPQQHALALNPNHGLVVGIRGAGKSVWWAALQSEQHRRVIAAALPRVALDLVSRVSAGFGEQPRPDEYPDKRVLKKLLGEGREAAEIWLTVIARHTWGQLAEDAPQEFTRLSSWSERVAWFTAHPEVAARSFKAYDDGMAAEGYQHLILFDALDRAAAEWPDLRTLLRGLLEVVLELRAYRAIRAKVFVRPDMLDDPRVTAFRDASKVTASQVDLRWLRADLYGLLWQHLANEPAGGAAFRAGCEALGSGRWTATDGIWQVPAPLRREELQRQVFHQIAGPWMGRDPRRGFPYTWLPNHLADAADQVSPRSFLAAIRAATLDTPHAEWPYALNYEGIKTGVQAASRIRVAEVQEDYPWVRIVMEPLHGLVIPCEGREILSRWQGRGALAELRQAADHRETAELLPKNLDDGEEGVGSDLVQLGVLSQQLDGRINMPDVYRVGFGLGRRGGVKPIR